MSTLIPCSVQVLTRNSMPGVERCLKTLTRFAEVIVQDGHSTDGTREAVKKFPNVTLMDQDRKYLDRDGRITNFAEMRNESIDAAKYDWVFVVDGDEEITSAMEDEVRVIVERNTPGVYQAFRRFIVDGVSVMYCCGYPTIQIRLFHRTLTQGYTKSVHERLVLRPGVIPEMLSHELPTPLPPAYKLRAKYHRYLQMEVRRLGVITWGRWFRWILLRHLKTALGYSLRVIWFRVIPKPGKRMPLAYEWQFIAHALRTIVATCPPVAARTLSKEAIASHTS